MKTTHYRQCLLRRSNSEHTAWIPEKFAVPGQILKIKEGVSWIDGYVVEFVGATTDKCPDIGKSIRGHRERTGDSLPKVRG